MCGIVGYTGNRAAQTVLLNSLAKLEYRGYDSCGIALLNHRVEIFKEAVRVADLANSLPPSSCPAGIGHTRWATHGAPCKVNAHPHTDCSGRIAVVHNGVISNYQQLRKQLTAEGHKFVSETDTEVISHLVEKYYKGNLEEALSASLLQLEGSYAIIVVAEGEPNLVFARKGSPLILGLGDRENFIASDVPAVLDYTNRVIYLEDGDIGTINANSYSISQNGKPVIRAEEKILWTPDQAQKAGYEHYMLKEIHEEPKIFRDTLSEYLSGREMPFDIKQLHKAPPSILLLACGTSYHAALIGKYVFERLLDIPIRVEMASEFNYFYKLPPTSITIGITQSGETADTLKALRRSKEAESKVIVITNVVGSTASKVADHTLYTRAGPEISVAATKSFMAQLVALYWLALSRSNLDAAAKNDLILSFKRLPDKLNQVLMLESTIAKSAYKLADSENVFFIGRGINYPIALEGALKLKEISYIHAEAYAAGEIKHGPFALLSPQTPVVAIIAGDKSHDAMLTSIKEIRARGAPIFAIVEDDDESIIDLADYLIPVPSTNELFSPFINTMVVQLMAYFAAKKRHCPIDFPRNLAKSVTVE
jgi:glucosamine--fructose-6-phosphate aminotransferase (isomerizing)